MRTVYICSPYRAKDSAELDRHIEYAQALTKQAIEAGLALLEKCDFVIAGVKYGISEGMSREIQTADVLGIEVVNADKLRYYMKCKERQTEDKAWDYAKVCACNFCIGSRLHSCTGYDCREPYNKAFEYAMKHSNLL